MMKVIQGIFLLCQCSVRMDYKQTTGIFGQSHARWLGNFFWLLHWYKKIKNKKIPLLAVMDFAPAVQISSTMEKLLPQNIHLSTDRYTQEQSSELSQTWTQKKLHYTSLTVYVSRVMFVQTITPEVNEANMWDNTAVGRFSHLTPAKLINTMPGSSYNLAPCQENKLEVDLLKDMHFHRYKSAISV